METTPRSEHDYTDLIAKFDRAHRMSCSDPDDPTRETFYSMARDAIEALVKERDELAAVVDGVKNLLAEASRFREADIDTWVNVLALKNVLYARQVREGEA